MKQQPKKSYDEKEGRLDNAKTVSERISLAKQKKNKTLRHWWTNKQCRAAAAAVKVLAAALCVITNCKLHPLRINHNVHIHTICIWLQSLLAVRMFHQTKKKEGITVVVFGAGSSLCKTRHSIQNAQKNTTLYGKCLLNIYIRKHLTKEPKHSLAHDVVRKGVITNVSSQFRFKQLTKGSKFAVNKTHTLQRNHHQFPFTYNKLTINIQQ